MKLLFTILLAATAVGLSMGHGYHIVPQARQSMCFEGASHVPGLWSNSPGTQIPDPACRAAFNWVYNKQNLPNPMERARVQFTYRNEYANFNRAPNHDRLNYPNVVPNGEICSAGNNLPDRPNSPPRFGDKTGMSQVFPWRTNTIYTTHMNGLETIKFQYCATAPHNPSIWHIYFQRGDPRTTPVLWETLDYLGVIQDLPVQRSPTALPNCFSLGAPHNAYYEYEMAVPMVPEGGTIVVAWQRIDPMGEFFMECIDIKPKAVGGPVPPPPPPPPPPPSEGCPRPDCRQNQSFNAPTTDPRRFYNCHNGVVSVLGCGSNMAFSAFRQCRALPIPESERFACQNWSLMSFTEDEY